MTDRHTAYTELEDALIRENSIMDEEDAPKIAELIWRDHIEPLREALNQAAAALAVIANHAGATHPGLADKDNLHSIRGFALECFHQARAALGDSEQ
jgi:hypothetical protein